MLLLLPAIAAADSMDDLRLRWRQILIGGASPDTTLTAVRSHLSSIQSNGNRQWSSMQKPASSTLWSDLASTTDSAQISSAYSRLHDMAIAWATPGQSLYQNAGLLADTIAGLDWMDTHRYSARSSEYGNWWDWEIGTPVYFVDIAVLLYDQLTADQVSRYMAAVDRFDTNPAILEVDTTKAVSTAANLTDKCKVALLRAILLKDQARIALAVKDLSPAFAYVTSGDGYYADGSYIQHTRHPYTGSYGLVCISDIADLFYLLAGSPFDVTDPNRANLASWITGAYSPLLYEGAMMDMVRGRAISRSSSQDHAIGHSTIGALLRITRFASDDIAAPLRSAIKRWLMDDTSRDYSSNLPFDLITEANRILTDDSIVPADLPSSGHVFASMDRAVHLRPAWAAGIAMHSTRIYNYENINNENLKGWHTADGMTYLYNSDLTQFSETFWPTVDPQRLPGTTVIAGSTARQGQLGGSNAVGGAALDGYTAVMMQLSPDGRQLSAKKSWFLFDDELVALGADINSTLPNSTVETVVENRRLGPDADFAIDSNPSHRWANLLNNGNRIGYVFPGATNWQILTATRTGAWRDINGGGSTTTLTAQYHTIWFDHGAMAAGATYSYILLPGKSADDTAAYAASPAVQIVQNDAQAQAVTHAALGIQAVNFWAPSAAPVAGISSDAVASVLVHQSNGLLNVAVADPTQANNGVIHIQIATAASAVVAQDDGVSVDQTSPAISLSINVKAAHGKPFLASFNVTQ